MKLCIDCVHYKPPRIVEAEKERQNKIGWFSVPMPPRYSSGDLIHRCFRNSSPITGEKFAIDAHLSRYGDEKGACGLTAQFFEAKR